MVYVNAENKNLLVTCSCGCGEGMEFRMFQDKEYKEYYISLCTSKWDAEQDHGFARLKYVLRKIWSIIRGKDFYYSEIVLTPEEWKEFKEKVNEVE